MGAMMGYILDRMLAMHTALNVANVTLVGHSLGAHTIAYAANWLTRNRTITLPVLIGGLLLYTFHLVRSAGLDPAGPLFQGEPIVTRMDPSDALFVQAIHTNGLPLTDGGATRAGGDHVCIVLTNSQHAAAVLLFSVFVDHHPFTPGFGTQQAMGTVDFMVNGGGKQPGCGLVTDFADACSHDR
jgi:pimeloyl-ACP methyl ester carboxylesterase